MATQTKTWLFDTHAGALAAVRDLESAGFTSGQVSILGQHGDVAETASDVVETTSAAGTGAAAGGAAGAGAGLLAGLGIMAIPGIGPLVAAGWLATALVGAAGGAAAGGLIGSLAGSGVEEREAHVYAESVRRGGTIVSVRADALDMDRAAAILAAHSPVNVTTREADYRNAGWKGYIENETVVSRPVPDGAPGNPPGTMASRAVDDVAGTNISGARPENELPRRG